LGHSLPATKYFADKKKKQNKNACRWGEKQLTCSWHETHWPNWNCP
jgi:hypothetical protein